MSGRKIPWHLIRAEFETMGLSHSKLSKKYNISVKSIEYHSYKEKWTEGRKTFQKSVREKTSATVLERAAEIEGEKLAEDIQKTLKASRGLLQIVLEALNDPLQFRRHLLKRVERDGRAAREWFEETMTDTYDTRRLYELSQALSRIQPIIKEFEGFLTKYENENLKIYQQRLELEKKRVGWTGTDESGKQYGVIEIPAPDFALLDSAVDDPNYDKLVESRTK